MKILFLTDNFPPESNAPATRTYEHCKKWVEMGEDVTVITCFPNFPQGKVFDGYKNKLFQREEIDGIKVIRVWSYISANKGFVKRVLDFVSYMIMAFLAGLFVKTDKIVATSPQFFTALAGRWLSFWKGKPWVMEVRDIWPESIVAVGASSRNKAIQFFEWLELRMYRSANQIVVVTDSFKKEILKKSHVDPGKISVIKNGANLALFQPVKKSEKLISKLGLEGKFIIGYIGTHGMAHALDFVLRSAQKVEDKRVHFLFVGDGAAKADLLELSKNLELNNTTFVDSVPKDLIGDYISILDVGLVNLKKSDTFKSVIPSKMFELTAMGKPLLLGVDGESEKMLLEYNLGVHFSPENEKEFLKGISILVEKDSKTWDFSRFLNDYDRLKLAENMLVMLEEK